MPHFLFLIKNYSFQMFRKGEDKAIRYRGEELSTCENDETLEELITYFLENEAADKPKLSFLISDENFKKYVRKALACSEKFDPSALCFYRLSDFLARRALENRGDLPSEKLAKIFFHIETAPEKEVEGRTNTSSSLAQLAKMSKVEVLKKENGNAHKRNPV